MEANNERKPPSLVRSLMPCLFPTEIEANEERKHPSFVRSLMSCNCDKIQTFLNEKIRTCLPQSLPNGKFVLNEEESEANQVMEKIVDALVPVKPNEGFNVESMDIEVAEIEIPLEHDQQLFSQDCNGDHDFWGYRGLKCTGYGKYAWCEGNNLQIEYRGLFKIHNDKKFLRIDMGGFFIPKSHWEEQEGEELRDKEWCENHYQDGPDYTE